MQRVVFQLLGIALLCFGLTACSLPTVPPEDTPTPTRIPTTPIPPTKTTAPTPTEMPLPSLSITLGESIQKDGIDLDQGGDVDTLMVVKGDAALGTHSTGNGVVLASPDNNTDSDWYMQFNVDDNRLLGGKPSTRVRLEVDYFDEGSDSFMLQYDASAGTFAGGGSVQKTNSLTFKTATFYLCDAYFGNRDNGADFRLADNGDGAEFIREVRVIALPPASAQEIRVDDFGANPFDDQPDSDAIQTVLDSACSGDMIVFTSGRQDANYQGYWIDKTLFLTGMSAKNDLTFTASNPANHALLHATADLKGYVVRLYARSRVNTPGFIDNIDFGYIDIHGGRDTRACMGSDNIGNEVEDNWGSWLPECPIMDDAWCMPGILGMDGGGDWSDISQDYFAHLNSWTTGVNVHDLTLEQGECGSALAFFSASSTIQNVTIDTAGDHVHASGCTHTDADGDFGGWSDGITLFGPDQTVINNTVINPSDIGIVFFGGKNAVISNNTIVIATGNYGAFGGIAIHPWIFGEISGLEMNNNQVTSQGNTKCGGLHAGINIGTHMWGGACLEAAHDGTFGNVLSCEIEPVMEEVVNCTDPSCQVWAYLPVGTTLTMKDNTVTGAHINYLIEGLALFGEFIDENNISQSPQYSDWEGSRNGCYNYTWGPLDKVAHHPALEGYTDIRVHCER